MEGTTGVSLSSEARRLQVNNAALFLWCFCCERFPPVVACLAERCRIRFARQSESETPCSCWSFHHNGRRRASVNGKGEMHPLRARMERYAYILPELRFSHPTATGFPFLEDRFGDYYRCDDHLAVDHERGSGIEMTAGGPPDP